MSSTRQTRNSSSTTEAEAFDDVGLNRFHLKITALTFGANFSDGYQRFAAWLEEHGGEPLVFDYHLDEQTCVWPKA